MDEARATLEQAQAKKLDSSLSCESQHIDPTGEGLLKKAGRKGDRGEARCGNSAARSPLRKCGRSAQGSPHGIANFRGPGCRGLGGNCVGPLGGDTPEAQRLAEDLAKRFPEDTSVQFNYLPTIRGSIALVQNAASKTIEELQTASELGTLPGQLSLMPVYIRAQAYLAAHDSSAAAAEFQKILDHRGVVVTEAIGVLAHLGLGRAYALEGDNAKARTAYQDFLTLWKDGDPDIPILQEAKAEAFRLQ
jgi:hypothetical protein